MILLFMFMFIFNSKIYWKLILVHPKTGKICVPFLAENVDEFDLSKVPTVTSIRSDEGREELQKAIEILEQLATACA